MPLSTADLAGASFSFYDKTQETITLVCNATLVTPGGTSFAVTAKSVPIAVLKPSVIWGITTGNVHYSTANSTSTARAYGLYPAFGSSASDGVYWHDVTVTVPQPFPGGTCCFTQLVKPNHLFNGTGHDVNNNVNGLDNSFKYSNYTWTAGLIGTAYDSPAILVGDGKTIGDIVTVNDTFNTWVMYQPTGGVWVPLQTYSYSWGLTLTWDTPGTWSMSGQSPPPPNPGPSYSGTNTNTPPQWSVVQTNYNH